MPFPRKEAFSMIQPSFIVLALVLAAPPGRTSVRTVSQQAAATGAMPVILPMRARAELRDRWLEQRLETVMPALMRREGIDLWIVTAREYDEDPVLATMLPSVWLRARRRTTLVFHDAGPERGVERYAVARYDVGVFEKSWDKERQPDQWGRLADLVAELDPEKIAIDASETFALADGISSTERAQLLDALPERLHERVVSGEALAIGWLETRTAEELEVYPTICNIAHGIMAEGLSLQAIQPGVTTTRDLEWWYRERIRELKLVTWFHPSVSVQRASESHSGSFASKPGEETIHRGDLIHLDFGITYLGLNTDTQQHAYVLRYGESAPPAGLVDGMKVCNRAQDILMENFVTGRTGNEILLATLEQARAEDVHAIVYTHPLGYHGHGAGPTIGLWDQQEGVPGRGDYPLYPQTAYSIELGVRVVIPEWGDQEINVMLEEDAFFDGESVRFLDGRQTELIVIP
jgi:Xaa-Pro aminopeptidase